MTFHKNFRRIAALAAVASAMVFGASVALAQPAAGMHGHGQGGDMIGPLIAHAKAQLNLNTMQQTLFDAAVADSKTAHQSARASHQKVKDAVQAELAKPNPNLRAVATIADSASNDAQTLRKQTREKWLQLYDTFSPDQKAVVSTILQKRMARAESFHQRMMERIRGNVSGAGN
jgi:Spy/CpxP family protein refolding chaperone